MGFNNAVHSCFLRIQSTWAGIKRRRRRSSWTDFYGQFIDRGDLCFDIGAHAGTKTEMMLPLGARVVCVEPQPMLVKVLDEKFGGNPNVFVVAGGLSSEQGELDLSLCSRASTIATFSESWKTGRFSDKYRWDATIRVPVFTLDQLVQKHGVPAFCKIDVEGFELEVLRGLSVPLGTVSIEYVRESLDQTTHCLEHLERLGATEFNYSLGEIPKLVRESWTDRDTILAEIRSCHAGIDWGDVYARFSGPDNEH